MDSEPGRGRVPPVCVAWGAVVVAFAFAMVSLAWALGSEVGLDTLGGEIERLARAGDRTLLTLNAVALALKVLGGLLALALMRPPPFARRTLLALGWSGAGILVLYGVLQTSSVALVALGVVAPAEPLSDRALMWRLVLWEPWFLVWGLLLGGATLRSQRLGSPRTVQENGSTRDVKS